MAASSSLSDFVKEQKGRGTNGGGTSVASALGSGWDELRSKVSTSATASSLSSWLSGPSSSSGARDGADEPLVEDEKSSAPRKSSWGLSESAFGLSRTQRFVGFFGCILAGLFCFGVASMYIPVLILKSRKFAALYALGSSFFLFSFALLWGPGAYLAHLSDKSRLPVTLTYFGSLLATLYCSLWLSSTLLTLPCIAVQVPALLWFMLSYIPGGERGLQLMSRLCCRFLRRQAEPKASILPL